MLTPIKIPASNLLDRLFYIPTSTHKKAVPRIGQGGFVVQIIHHHNLPIQVIYDCGATPLGHLSAEINNLDANIYTILALSHFHRDHINGIKQLKNRKINIRKVILPHIDVQERVLSAADMDDDDISRFILDPKSMFDAHIIYISNLVDSGSQNSPVLSNMPDNGIIPHNSPYQILSGHLLKPAWMVKFYTATASFELLNKEDGDLIDRCTDFETLLANKGRLKEIYQRISKGNQNKTSMLMFIFPKFKNGMQKWLSKASVESLIMCTGDMQITSEASSKIRNHYFPELGLISCVMIPHHGSDGYFNNIPFPQLSCCFLQAGKNNLYGHPSDVLKRSLRERGLSVEERII